jgi:hypothetical protein
MLTIWGSMHSEQKQQRHPAGHIGTDEDDEAAATLATGVLHLRLADFVRQLATIRVDGPHRAAGLERFGRLLRRPALGRLQTRPRPRLTREPAEGTGRCWPAGPGTIQRRPA